MWPFGKSLVQKAEEAVAKVEGRINGLIKSEQEARIRVVQLEKELSESRSIVSVQAGKIRAQTEADLYLISAKIMRDIMKDGSAKEGDIARQSALQGQMLAYNQAAQAGSTYGYGALSALGGIFGR